MSKRARCVACGAFQPYGRIRCTECGKPLVFAVGTTITTTRTPRNHCLNCGATITAASATPDFPDESKPNPGDIAVCLHCAHIHIHADDLTLRAPSEEEIVDIAGDLNMIRAVEAVGLLNRRSQLHRRGVA